MKHLLKMMDLSKEEIIEILDLADELKMKRRTGQDFRPLSGKKLGMIFQKASTRTRVSFETGMYELGGYPLFLSAADLQIGRGEPIEDTARVLSRYLDGIMIRTYRQSEVEDLAKFGTIPIINGLTDYAHPCQVLADLQTIREYKKDFNGLKMAYIGDGNNMANSLITGCLKVGMDVACAIPLGYEPAANVLEFAQSTGRFNLLRNPIEAAEDADVVITDVWASMGQENEAEQRKIDFDGIQVNNDVMKAAHSDAIVQHCLPAHKGEEISNDVFEAHACEIFDEAENRLHAQKAIMTLLMG